MLKAGERAVDRCRELGLARYSETVDGLFRPFLSPALRAAQSRLRGWMEEAGMTVRVDPATNLVGRYEGTDPAAPALVIGSHLDSVRDGGCFDGPLGIMLGIELVAALHAAGRRLPFPIEVYAFGDEEGSRFPAAMLTSRAVAGILDPATLATQDEAGIALAQAAQAWGADATRFAAAARAPGGTLAYLEAHIEQGPVLEAEGLPIGTVSGIVAQRRCRIRLSGMAGHAGTVAMPYRRDALAGAAEMVGVVERLALEHPQDLVATVGLLEARPGAPNVIAGGAEWSLDVRSLDLSLRDQVCDAILAECHAIAARRGLEIAVEEVLDLPPTPCDHRLMALLDDALAAQGLPPRRLVSGAGHDAMNFAAHCPVAMLFIRCRGGISHNPAEHVEPADAAVALAAMRHFADHLEPALAA